jgi:asparagine synthase (glutamine-hydrolysing)
VPLYYFKQGNSLYFASRVPLLLDKLGFKPVLNRRWLAHALLSAVDMGGPVQNETLYRGVNSLAAGCYYRWTMSRFHCVRYLSLNSAFPFVPKSKKEAYECFDALLSQAIDRSLTAVPQLAVELSGGLDSSLVTAMVAERVPRLVAYQHVVDQGGDQASLRVKALTSAPHIEYQALDGRNFDMPYAMANAVQRYGMPVLGLYPLFAETLYRSAAGSRLLSGFGGDQCLSDRGGRYLRSLLRQRAYRSLYDVCATDTTGCITAWRRLWLAATRDIGLNSTKGTKAPRFLLQSELAVEIKELLLQRAAVNREVSQQPWSVQQWQQLYGLDSEHVHRRLECSSVLAAAYGVDYAYPLLDRDLVDYVLAMPAQWRFEYRQGRLLLRRALSVYLPEKLMQHFAKQEAVVPGALKKFDQTAWQQRDLATPFAAYSAERHASLQKGLARRYWCILAMLEKVLE